MDATQKLKNVTVPDVVVYWRWITANKLALVGKVAVYHMEITNTDQPVKVFERVPQMASCQIMSYDIDPEEKWCYLVGLYSPDQKNINAQMQLYNMERKQQQLLEGYSACFANIPVTDSAPGYTNNLFAFCEKKASETQIRLHIMEIGNPAPGAQKFKITTDV